MGEVMDFYDKYRHKQIDFERQNLQDVSLIKIQESIKNTFDGFLEPLSSYMQTVVDMCIDYAVESFLLGASYSRLGYYGVEMMNAFQRSREPFKMLVDDLYDFWIFWYYIDNIKNEAIHKACESFLYYWWKEGFETALKRYRMRLH
ncbi:DUF2521 family protein [Terrilactibacillus laevilacticus]|uniref:DUF2521 family protein n=1 Tax=Terrilactibacillus laevilacticus TaxID=1380157 RepID=A0ABW5PRG5_9BACI|nr:DUF2521 family protein [Terrilactibacillus laevilacticus]